MKAISLFRLAATRTTGPATLANDTTGYTFRVDSLTARGKIEQGITGAIGGAARLRGEENFIITPTITNSTSNGMTFYAWANPTCKNVPWSSYQYLVSIGGGNQGDYTTTALAYYDSFKFRTRSNGSGGEVNSVSSGSGTGLFPTNTWSLVAGTYYYDSAADQTYMKGYINGVQVISSNAPGLRLRATMYRPLVLGAIAWSAYPANNPGQIFVGMLDEVRVATNVHSDAWIAACYTNQADPDALLTFGEIQILPSGTLVGIW